MIEAEGERVSVCVCLCVRERERKKENKGKITFSKASSMMSMPLPSNIEFAPLTPILKASQTVNSPEVSARISSVSIAPSLTKVDKL